MPLILQRLWLQLTADRRRFSVLCVACVVGLLLWSRMVLISNVPRTAMADPSLNQTSPAKSAKDAGKNNTLPERRTEAVAVLASRPNRDPFAISDRIFPKPPNPNDDSDLGQNSGSNYVEDPQQVEARLVARLNGLVARLTLDASMSGPSLAVISGKTYRLFDEVTVKDKASDTFTFKLVEVRNRSVVLEYDGRLFELTMAQP